MLTMSHNQQNQNTAAANGPPQGRSDIDLEIDLEMFERRRYIRRIPCPDAVERNDEQAWTDWDQLTG
jgi:hypothetical protein